MKTCRHSKVASELFRSGSQKYKIVNKVYVGGV